MIFEIEVSAQANLDLRSIYNYIAHELQSPKNAIRQLNRLEDGIMSLDKMPERFRLKVNTLLNVEGLAFGEDGKVALSEDQVKAINEKLDALETENANQKTKLDEQNTQINNLKNNDGASTTDIEGEGEGDNGNTMQSAQEMFNAVKELV